MPLKTPRRLSCSAAHTSSSESSLLSSSAPPSSWRPSGSKVRGAASLPDSGVECERIGIGGATGAAASGEVEARRPLVSVCSTARAVAATGATDRASDEGTASLVGGRVLDFLEAEARRPAATVLACARDAASTASARAELTSLLVECERVGIGGATGAAASGEVEARRRAVAAAGATDRASNEGTVSLVGGRVLDFLEAEARRPAATVLACARDAASTASVRAEPSEGGV